LDIYPAVQCTYLSWLVGLAICGSRWLRGSTICGRSSFCFGRRGRRCARGGRDSLLRLGRLLFVLLAKGDAAEGPLLFDLVLLGLGLDAFVGQRGDVLASGALLGGALLTLGSFNGGRIATLSGCGTLFGGQIFVVLGMLLRFLFL